MFWRLLWLAVLGIQVYALVDAAVRPAAAYEAANRWTKVGWVTVLALSLVIGQALSLFSFIGLAALVATIVYFVDVRPALQRLS